MRNDIQSIAYVFSVKTNTSKESLLVLLIIYRKILLKFKKLLSKKTIITKFDTFPKSQLLKSWLLCCSSSKFHEKKEKSRKLGS